MILAQWILIAMLSAIAAVCFMQLRSRVFYGALITLGFVIASLLVMRPGLVTILARWTGLRRSLDLVICLVIPIVALLIVLLFARTRELNAKLTATIREIAILNVTEKLKMESVLIRPAWWKWSCQCAIWRDCRSKTGVRQPLKKKGETHGGAEFTS